MTRENLVPPLAPRTCQHEFLNSNALGFALNMDADVTKHVWQLFVQFEQMGISRVRLLKEDPVFSILGHLARPKLALRSASVFRF